LPIARVTVADGFLWLPGAIPRSAAVALMDPPYEARDEIDRAVASLAAAHRAAPHATLMLWYPLKGQGLEARFRRARAAARLPAGIGVECRAVPPDHPPGLHGGAVWLLNSPAGIRAPLDAALRWAVQAMAGRLGSVRWPQAGESRRRSRK